MKTTNTEWEAEWFERYRKLVFNSKDPEHETFKDMEKLLKQHKLELERQAEEIIKLMEANLEIDREKYGISEYELRAKMLLTMLRQKHLTKDK